MTITVDRLPECKARIQVDVPAGDVATQRKQIVQLYASQAKIPGFRPGKIPAAVIEKRFKEGIEAELEERLTKQALGKAVADEKLDILGVEGAGDHLHRPDGGFTFTINITTAPEFELPDYKSIPVQVPKLDVTDEQLAEALDQIRERFADYADVEERGAEMGDFAVIDYRGAIDGRSIGEAAPTAPATMAQNTGFWLRLAEDSFLPGFCAALLGAKAGDSREVTVTIPDDFPDEALRGRSVDYAVEVKELKSQVLPELDDDFADKVESGKTLGEVKDSLRERMLEQREGMRREMITNQVLDKINAGLNFELPKEVVARETQSRVDEIVSSNSERGISEEEIMKNQQEIISAAGQQAALSVKTSFILEQIADAENIEVGKEEILVRVAEIAARNNTPVKKLYRQLEKQKGFGRIHNGLRIQKTIAFLADNAQVEEVDAPQPTG